MSIVSPSIPQGATHGWPLPLQLEGIVAPSRADAVSTWRNTRGESGTIDLGAQWVGLAASDESRHATYEMSHLVLWGTIASTDADQSTFAAQLLRSYLGNGLPAFENLAGLAVIAVWDAKKEKMILIRHPGGAPRLLYRVDDGVLRWSTHLGALVEADDSPDELSIVMSLMYSSVLPPRTMSASVMSVKPGHALIASEGGISEHRLWSPSWPQQQTTVSIEETTERIDTILTESIQNWLRPAHNPAILMSGGIDSAGLPAAMTRAGWEPTAYTISFEGDAGFIDEFDEAHLVTEHLGLKHEPIVYKPEFLHDHLDWMVAWYEGVIGYGVHTANLSLIQTNGHDFVLGGTGPDTWYRWAADYRWKPILDRLSPAAAKLMASLIGPVTGIRGFKGLGDSLNRHAAGSLQAVLGGMGPTTHGQEMRDLLADPDLSDRAVESSLSTVADFFADLPTDNRLAVQSFGWTFFTYSERSIYWMSRWSEAYGMSPALPYIDSRFPRLLAALANQGRDRYEFRELALKSLPRGLAYNRKIGQSLPLASWFRGPLKDDLYDRLTEPDAFGNLIRRDTVRNHLDNHMSERTNKQWLLWKLLTLSAWNRRFRELRATAHGPR